VAVALPTRAQPSDCTLSPSWVPVSILPSGIQSTRVEPVIPSTTLNSQLKLAEALVGPSRSPFTRSPARERAGAEAVGLEVVDVREAALRCVFDDIAAVVYFLRLVVWIVPDFSVDRYRPQLRALHERIRAEGPFVATSHRFLIEAHMPPRTQAAER